MKIIAITLIIVLFAQYSFCQNKNVKLDNLQVLIGTLNDYMGRQIVRSEDKIDSFYGTEEQLVVYLYSILKNEYPDLAIKNQDISEKHWLQFDLESSLLTKKVDHYYDYEFANKWSSNGDSIFVGTLKPEMLKTKAQKLSFLAGTYLKFGEVKDHKYYIRISNSLSKTKICVDLLQKLGCSKVEYHIYKERIPNGHEIVFVPTKLIKTYLDEFAELKQKIDDDYKTFTKQLGIAEN